MRDFELFKVFRRVFHVLPGFAILSLVGCTIGKLAGVPADQLAVTVAVPIVLLFLLTRIVILALPPLPVGVVRSRVSKPPFGFRALSVTFFVMGAGSILVVTSSLIYSRLGLDQIATLAMRGGLEMALGAVLVAVMGIAYLLYERLDVSLPVLINLGIWKIIRCPGRLGDFLDLRDPHSSV